MNTLVLSEDVAHPLKVTARDLLTSSLDPRGPVLASWDVGEQLLGNQQDPPRVVVLLLSPAVERALEVLRAVRPLVSGVILAVGPAGDSRLILKALHLGADHYLDEEDVVDQFNAVLPRLPALQEQESKPPGRVVSLLAAGGGSGTSTLAVNLAVVLAQQAGRCGLLDLKPGFGDLASLLDQEPTHTLADLCLHAARLDHAMLDKALVSHPSGVHLVAPPLSYKDVRLLTPAGVSRTLQLLRERFPFVVIDQEDCFHEEQVTTLHKADDVLVVARLDFTSVRNAHRILDYLGQLNIPRDRVRLVVNRQGQAKELPVAEVEEALGLEACHLVPDDPRAVNGANNTGVPLVLKSPSSKAARAISGLGRSLLPAQPQASRGPHLMARMRQGWLASFL